MRPVEVSQGLGPIVLGLPHAGTHVPKDIATALNARGLELADTDWHIDTLYEGLMPNVTTVRANFHRYVIDANRDPQGQSLYPGQNTTGLVPLTDFDGKEIWRNLPLSDEIERRRQIFHAPYHEALEAEMQRVTHLHGVAILHDCHSIRSTIPFLFDGTLPDFNIGTNNGLTCANPIASATHDICANAASYTSVLNGRFKGGWTTRHYGRPQLNWHAIQMELAQSTYLATEAPPWTYDVPKADKIRLHLRAILTQLQDLATNIGKYDDKPQT
jgi:N-formylglutamate deformylase